MERDEEIEIVIDGKVFAAKLLWKIAPKTCQAILDALPIDHTTTMENGAVHSAWAGDVIMVRWAFDKLPITVPPENETIFLREGNCAWKTVLGDTKLNEIYICYRYGHCQYWRGANPYNDFAKITEKLDQLSEVGRDIYLGGGRKTFVMRRSQDKR